MTSEVRAHPRFPLSSPAAVAVLSLLAPLFRVITWLVVSAAEYRRGRSGRALVAFVVLGAVTYLLGVTLRTALEAHLTSGNGPATPLPTPHS